MIDKVTGAMENIKSICVSNANPSEVMNWEKGINPTPIAQAVKISNGNFMVQVPSP